MIQIYDPDASAACRAFTRAMMILLNESSRQYFTIAISGGGTANLLFHTWAEEFAEILDWKRIKLFWVDERCVDPASDESNYKHAQVQFLHLGLIPASQVFRIPAEDANPERVCRDYQERIAQEVLLDAMCLPVFDLIFLGIGEDGHTASLFPNTYQNYFIPTIWVDLASHPVSQQARITLTYPILNRARNVFFLVLGENKRAILEKLVLGDKVSAAFPAKYIHLDKKKCYLFTDVLLNL